MNGSTTSVAAWQTSEPVIDAYVSFLHLQLNICGLLRLRFRKARQSMDAEGAI
jgi:hypothetical protein